MPDYTVTARNPNFRRLLRSLPAILSGDAPDPKGLRRSFLAALLYNAFKRTHEAYLTKADGGADEYGESWDPLSPKTIASRPITQQDQRQYGVRKGQRGLLTAEQNRRWKGIFASVYFRELTSGTLEKEAKAVAGRIAWAILKSQGAKTRIGTLSKRDVPIMIDKGRLERSFRPGALTKNAYRRYNRDQVAEIRERSIRFGSSVPYAKRAAKKRPVIPTAKQFRVDILRDARDRLIDRLREEV